MLDKLLNKKVKVAVAFNRNSVYSAGTEYYKGILVAYDDKFIRFETDTLIAIKYIQGIELCDDVEKDVQKSSKKRKFFG